MSTEQESERIVLDHIDNISFDPNNPRLQNFHAIKYLSKGLYHLAATVRREELAYNRKLGGHIVFSLDAQDPVIDTVSCYFNWFAVSLTRLRLRPTSVYASGFGVGWRSATASREHRMRGASPAHQRQTLAARRSGASPPLIPTQKTKDILGRRRTQGTGP
jgi:hypothetical protein